MKILSVATYTEIIVFLVMHFQVLNGTFFSSVNPFTL